MAKVNPGTGLDRRDEMILMIFAVVTPLATLPVLLGL